MERIQAASVRRLSELLTRMNELIGLARRFFLAPIVQPVCAPGSVSISELAAAFAPLHEAHRTVPRLVVLDPLRSLPSTGPCVEPASDA